MARRIGPAAPGQGGWADFRRAVAESEGGRVVYREMPRAPGMRRVQAAVPQAARPQAATSAPPQQRVRAAKVEPREQLPWRNLLAPVGLILLVRWLPGDPELLSLIGFAALVTLIVQLVRRIWRWTWVRQAYADFTAEQPAPTPQAPAAPPQTQPTAASALVDFAPPTQSKKIRVSRDVTAEVERAVAAVTRGGYGALRDGFPQMPPGVIVRGVGAAAEERVGKMLEARLPDPWQGAPDPQVPSPRGKGQVNANIDHLLSGPAGLIMVDTKSWSGRTGVRGGVLADVSDRARGGKSAEARANAVSTCLYEAGALATKPRLLVIAVDGQVAGPDGMLSVPHPRTDEPLPRIPTVAIRTDLLIDYLLGLSPAVPVDLARLIKASRRISLPR